MNKKKKIIIFITIFIIIFIIFISLKDKKINLNSGNKEEVIPEYQAESIDLEFDYIDSNDIEETSSELEALNLAKNFTERFGSWSTDNQGINLIELLSLSTAKMKQYLNNINLNYNIEEFLGLSTKALATETILFDEEEGEAKVLVKTQRIKTAADLSTEVYYQNIEIYLIFSGNKWLVEEANWQ